MQGHNLLIPPEIELLMKKDIWPDSYEKELKQNSKAIFPIEHLKHIIPEEETIYFGRPPFRTVRQDLKSDTSNYWSEFGAVSEINPDLSIIIGDFGLGSDAPLILKYESQNSTPSVWKLVWAEKGNYWREVSPSFKEFLEALGLGKFLTTYIKPLPKIKNGRNLINFFQKSPRKQIAKLSKEILNTEFLSKENKTESIGIKDAAQIVSDYLKHKEYGLAYEHLAYVITETGVQLTSEQEKQMGEIASRMNMIPIDFDVHKRPESDSN